MKPRLLLPCIAFCLVAALAHATDTLKPQRTTTPPTIDGKLDDAVWQEATPYDGFQTVAPDFGKTPAESTVAYLAYDSENLYFAVRCFDHSPDKIKASLTNRDNIRSDDWICINLDTFGDQQSLYALYVNPLGVQGDSRYAAGTEDASIDLVWHSAGRLDTEGYTVEIRLPLKSVRFSNADPVTMSIIFERHISRYGEQDMYPAMDPAQGDNIITQMAPFSLHNLRRPRLFEVLPAVTYNYQDIREDGRMVSDARDGEVSLTAKVGLTSDLVLDGTLNPDFSQVEADAGQVDVNLRAALFLTEKRPFFLEGRENLIIGATKLSERDPVRSLFHTRAIVNPSAGIKLNGKIGTQNTLACLYAADDQGGDQAVHFPTLRFRRTLDGDGFLGGMVASRESDDGYNRMGGVDGRIRLTPSSSLSLQGYASTTRLEPDSADAETQDGHVLGLGYVLSSRNWDAALSLREVSKNFQADMAYVNRTGLRQATLLARPKLYPSSSTVRRVDLEFFSAQSQDLVDDMWETFNHASALFYLWGSITLKVKYSYSSEIYLAQKFDTGGFHVFGGGQLNNQLYFGVLYRYTGAVRYVADPFQGKSNQLTVELNYQPSDKFSTYASFLKADFTQESTGADIYDNWIAHCNLTYQFNRYLFFRTIFEYTSRSVYDLDYKKRNLLTDFLISFTYIPGTVMHLGYGSLHNQDGIPESDPLRYTDMRVQKRGFFFKTSYLWRI